MEAIIKVCVFINKLYDYTIIIVVLSFNLPKEIIEYNKKPFFI